jgi:hypothetical protein
MALVVLMTLHGFAHVVGFVVPWQLGPVGASYKTTLLGGHVDVGAGGIRTVGVFWLVGALGFWAAAAAAASGRPWWVPLTLAVTFYSLSMSLIDWPDARVGVFVNLALLAALVVGRHYGMV